jgi:hypothetical protein
MSSDLQARFKELAGEENIYVGGRFATQNDLCALFTVRSVRLYLRSGGRLAFVLPMAVLSRGQFGALRSGAFASVHIAWDEVWTMDDSVQPLFPVPSCVVFGRRLAAARPLPQTVRAYSGTLPCRDASEAVADRRLTVTEGAPALSVSGSDGGSSYRKLFRNGATLVPRVLCLVERPALGRLGGDPGAPFVASRRNNQEKQPWKDLPGVESRVEAEFLRPVLLGESILPYRVFQRFEGVIPVAENGAVLDAEAAANRGIEGLNAWMRKAESVWNSHQGSSLSLARQFDYYGKLASQFPLAPLRVVYAKAGIHPAATLLRDPRGVIDHKLYWMAPPCEDEGYYLVAILNSETARGRYHHYQARGQFGARDVDKVVFNLPIPRFEARQALHQDLATAGRRAEALAGQVALPDGVKFQRARGLIRDALTQAGMAATVDTLVARLLAPPK